MINYTNQEIERLAYIAGNTTLANVASIADDFDQADYSLDFEFTLNATLQTQIEKFAESKTPPDYEAYKQFFYDCFERLNGRYPCPSITSDYDQSVIFEAIEKGEAE